MPLVLWPVQPEEIFKDNKLKNTADVLESQRAHSLCNVLRQLSSLASNVEDIFGEISNELTSIGTRASSLTDRINKLKDQVKFDPSRSASIENVPKEWTLTIQIGAPTVTRNTMPAPLEKLYMNCYSIPDLARLDKYKSDNVPCVSLYSKPEFFFEQWITEFDKDIAMRKQRRDKKKNDRQTSKLDTSKPRMKTREVIIEKKDSVITAKKEQPRKEASENIRNEVKTKPEQVEKQSVNYEEEIAPLEMNLAPVEAIEKEDNLKISSSDYIPPPPPAPKIEVLKVQAAPPPPPPPNVKAPIPPPVSNQSSGTMDLLSSIRKGKELKAVEIQEKPKVDEFATNNIASILARRIQLAGDSDSDEDVSDDEDDDWD